MANHGSTVTASIKSRACITVPDRASSSRLSQRAVMASRAVSVCWCAGAWHQARLAQWRGPKDQRAHLVITRRFAVVEYISRR